MWCFFLPIFASTVAAYKTKSISVPASSREALAAARAQIRTNTTNKSINPPIPAILGGIPAGNNEFPWFGITEIFLTDLFNINILSYCGSSLIHSDIAVSAASCIVGDLKLPYFSVTFYLGANEYDGSDGIELEAETYIYPDNYEFPFNDMVFYKLKTAATNVVPVSWNTNALIPLAGDIGTAIGYGVTSDSSEISAKVDLPAITNSECSKFYNNIPDSITCVYAGGQKKDIGGVDLGGPILTKGGVLYGVASFSGATNGATPSGFTRTSYLSDFISAVSNYCYGLV